MLGALRLRQFDHLQVDALRGSGRSRLRARVALLGWPDRPAARSCLRCSASGDIRLK
jgi:hypothetical protein